MDTRAAASRGGLVGLALVGLSVGVHLVLLAAVRAAWPGPRAAVLALLLLPAAGMTIGLAYATWGYYTLRYGLSRDGLVIRWAAGRQVIPMSAITHLLNGRPYAERLRGLSWPGYEIGRTRWVDQAGRGQDMLVYATVPPPGQLIVLTTDVAYAISPADRAAFVEEFKTRLRLGPVQALEHGTEHLGWARLTIWRDDLALRLAAVGLGLNVLAFAWLIWQYPTLPATVVLRQGYDAVAGRAAPGAPEALAAAWGVPLVGLMALMLNAVLAAVVHARARLGSLLLVLGAVLLQLAIIVILIRMA